ncbi:RNA polymerase sigma factor [Algoriphagus chordae]|uniref:RNA polymerase sigma-70 factor (ECF subfamily) n=1 Tax=Algoriphagus chordae TaxID=237019 RepID=A0A2W7S515_9BACT|nr:sigma-70 family RNA polymerase sigma factor [Algoriphagus chordae]PZX58085.1 RNA polymerase sigma-70 factor (ECF subfamily) [Algoriphagus chordae]
MQPTTDRSSEFTALLQANKGILYKVARTYCFSEEEQKDLIQEISFQVWKSFSGYDPKYKFSTWLYRVALNVAISNLRKESKRKEITSPLQDEIVQFSIPDADPVNEQVAQLYAAIGELKSLDKALMLLYLEEKSYVEIADIMGISETNVATKLSRIKKLIKEKLLTLNRP